MSAVLLMQDIIVLTSPCGFVEYQKSPRYYTANPRDIPPVLLQDAILDISSSRPTYKTRRMAAQTSRVLGRPVNRMAASRIFKKLGWK